MYHGLYTPLTSLEIIKIMFIPAMTDRDEFAPCETSSRFSTSSVWYDFVLHRERVHCADWLWKAYGSGPKQIWKRQWVRCCLLLFFYTPLQQPFPEDSYFSRGLQVYLLDDRLCYTNNPSSSESVKYLPLDRIPVRPLPRHYGPQIGVSRISSLQIPRRPDGCVFGVHCGRRTHFMAAESAASAKVRSLCPRNT